MSRMIFPFEEPEVDGPIGCAMVVDYGDGWRSVGTLTGVGPVKVDEYGLVSYEVSFEPQRTCSTALDARREPPPFEHQEVWGDQAPCPSPVVNRVSSGLRKPRLVDGVAFGRDRSRGMYSEALSMNLRSFEDWRKSLEESQFSWLGHF